MKIESHVKIPTRRSSTSKIVYKHEWTEIESSLGSLRHWLFCWHGVEAIVTQEETDVQFRLVVNYKSAAKNDQQALNRAHAVDGFIGGWLSHHKFTLGQ